MFVEYKLVFFLRLLLLLLILLLFLVRTHAFDSGMSRDAPDPKFSDSAGSGSRPDPQMLDPARSGSGFGSGASLGMSNAAVGH